MISAESENFSMMITHKATNSLIVLDFMMQEHLFEYNSYVESVLSLPLWEEASDHGAWDVQFVL